jgi:hypothetical protein
VSYILGIIGRSSMWMRKVDGDSLKRTPITAGVSLLRKKKIPLERVDFFWLGGLLKND